MRAWPRVAATCALFVLFRCGLQRKQNAADAAAVAEVESAAESASPATDAGQAPPVAPLSSAEPAHRHVGSRCAGREVAILLRPGDETCVVECKSAASCPAGWACDGEGVLSNGGRPGSAIRFCLVASYGKATDAGPGSSPAVDAGHATPPPLPKDAGPPPKKLDVKLVSGQCPSGYRTCGAGCRLACAKDTDCSLASAHCQNGYCLGPGAQPCAK